MTRHGPRGRGRLRSIVAGRRLDRAARVVDAEIEAHLQEVAERLAEEGLGQEEARAEALRRFGEVSVWRERMVRIERRRVRRRWTMEWIQGLRSGLTFAARSVTRAPGFAAAVVLTLALGIGANATVFQVVDRMLLRAPDHLEQPSELRRLLVRHRGDGTSGAQALSVGSALTFPDIQDLRGVEAFAGVGAWARMDDQTLGEGASARKIRVRGASADLFEVLGAHPVLGRGFSPDDDRPDAPPTAVLGWAFWNAALGADPEVLGRVLHIGDGRYEVIGVAPRGFTGAELAPVDAWLALQPAANVVWGDDWVDNRGWWTFRAVARLKPGTTDEAAQAQATAAHRAGRADDDRYDLDASILVAPVVTGRGPDAPAEAAVARWLAGVSLAVLLIACFNVANLFLARAVRWRRELAIRLALGSSRKRLTAHFMAESLALALAGAGVAVLVSLAGGRLLLRALLPDVVFDTASGDLRIVAFTFVVSVVAAVLAGLVPALWAGRTAVQGALKAAAGRGATAAGSRLRIGLVAAQSGLTAVLLVGAGLFLRSLEAARTTDLGFDPERVAAVRIERGEEQTERTAEIYRRIEEALPRIAGVEAAARTTSVPFRQSFGLEVHVPAIDTMLRNPDGSWVGLTGAGPDYFRTLGLDVVDGRGIEPADLAAEAELVAVVNRRMAETVWPVGDAVGQCVKVGGSGAPCARVVGVVTDHTSWQIDEVPKMRVFTPVGRGGMAFVWAVLVRTDGAPVRRADAIRAEIRAVAPEVRFVEFQPLEELVGERFRSWRLGASLFGVFGVLAVLVAGLGLYGVLSFEIARRRRELGIRLALGAPAGRVVRGVVALGSRAVALGALVGMGIAAVAAPRIEALLYGVQARDPVTFVSTGLLLTFVALAASGLPAWRATRVDPTDAMRAE